VDSGGLSSAPATVSLTIWPMDDHIQVTAPGQQTLAEDTSVTFSTANGNAITVIDIESPPVLVALTTNNGILTLPNTAGLVFYPGYPNNSSSIAFYADDPAEANAALNGLVFTPNANFNGNTYLDVWVEDQSFVAQSVNASAFVPLSVTSVNDVPVAMDDSYSVQAGMPLITTAYYSGGNNPLGVLANDQDADWDPLYATL